MTAVRRCARRPGSARRDSASPVEPSGQEARLLQVDAAACGPGRAQHARLEERHAGLVEERVKGGLDVLARRRVLGVEEVVGRRVAEAMLRRDRRGGPSASVSAPAQRSNIGEDAAALLVGDGVERVLDVVRRSDRLADGARAHERVGAHRALRTSQECDVRVQLRVPRCRRPCCPARWRRPR